MSVRLVKLIKPLSFVVGRLKIGRDNKGRSFTRVRSTIIFSVTRVKLAFVQNRIPKLSQDVYNKVIILKYICIFGTLKLDEETGRSLTLEVKSESEFYSQWPGPPARLGR